MNKFLVAVMALFFCELSFGQVSFRIDTLELSHTDERIVTNRGSLILEAVDSLHPRMKIVATVTNHTQDTISIYFPGDSSHYFSRFFFGMRAEYRGCEDYQFVAWKNPKEYRGEVLPGCGYYYRVYGLWLVPEESAEMELGAFMPTNDPGQDVESSYMKSWEGTVYWPDGVTDEDAQEWFESIIPTMRVTIWYGTSRPFALMPYSSVESDPIDPEKTVIISRL